VIKINELRIGNLISDLSDRTGFVKSLAWNKVAVKLEFSTINTDCDGVKPIPLTEEWLNKFKWERVEENRFFFDNNYFSIGISGRLYYMDDYTGVKIQHVHQLQNLYFSGSVSV